MTRRALSASALLLLGLAAIGCGARTPATAPESAPAPEAEPRSLEQAPISPAGDAESEEAAPSAAPAEAGGAPMPGSAQKSKGAIQDESSAVRDLERLSQDLDAALRLSAPDCTTAWSLRDRICDLADRLCEMADRSAEPEVQERCGDGKVRCTRATARVRASCAE